MAERKRGIWGVFRALWRGVDTARKIVLNLLFLAVLLVLLALLGQEGPTIPGRAALVVAPRGLLVEQLAGDPLERATAKLLGEDEPETLVRDVVDAIRAAKDDRRIQALLLDLDAMAGGGLTKLEEIHEALADFRAGGKPVVATADAYDQSRYYLATAADEVYLHPMGLVLLEGYGRFPTYYKDAIDRLGVDWHVFWVGEYKSATEPFRRRDMSEEARRANLDWLGDLWSSYLAEVAAARHLAPEAIEALVAELPERLRSADGDLARLAVDAGLVDGLMSREELRRRMIELVGEDAETHSFHRVDLEPYVESLDREPPKGAAVGVVVAKGEILDGTQPPGLIGGESTAALIRQARHDDAVKAIVLRVDSGGGSAFASEIIRRELAVARQEGKPVVVSMGSVAASGGYWISTASDEIWARPTTITGSIGIFGMFPTFQKPLEKYLGMNVDGVGTTWLAGAVRPDRALPERAGDVIQALVDRGYRDFLERVAEGRGMTPEQVDAIARGRVWSGADAAERGLVDHLGGLDQAIAAAAERAGLKEGYGVRYLEREVGLREQLLVDLFATARAWFPHVAALHRPATLGGRLLSYLDRQAGELARFNDPQGLYAACLCEVE